jgi:hypothetical protein
MMPDVDELQPHWIELIGLLVRHRVRFLIVGAHALAAHGRPRYSDDFDVFVDSAAPNVRRLAAAISDFGFEATASAIEEQFALPKRMVTLGRTLPIDIMNAISGVTFATAWNGRVRTVLAGHQVAVIGPKEFVRNKRASGRPKDLLDLALLAEVEAPRANRSRKAPRGRPSSASSRPRRPR